MKTELAAAGKWHGILKSFGLSEEFLRNKHGPCPLCGGKDRWRFDDKNGTGSYYCSHCGPGNGFDLAIKYSGKDFKTVAKEIDKIVGNIEANQNTDNNDEAARRKRIQGIVAGLVPDCHDSPVRRYLKSRELPFSKALQCHPRMKYWEDGQCLGMFPAMIASIRGPDNRPLSLHVTYLTLDGRKADVPAQKKILSPMSKLNGGAIRLTGIYPKIGIAEGIETALAVMRDYKIPCWASATEGLMRDFVPPAGVESVSIFGDNDGNFVGQSAAYDLAKRLSRTHRVEVFMPDCVGDFADIRGIL